MWFLHFFSLYIDPLLLELKRYLLELKRTYIGVLSYADAITLSCPSIWGLNDMLKICEKFSVENSILFNKEKTICIKFGSKVKEVEMAILDSSDLLWTDNVVHLGNYINSACNDDVDCDIKTYFLIGYVNKRMANMGYYRQVFWLIYSSHIAVLFMVRIYGNSILLVLINAANPGI